MCNLRRTNNIDKLNNTIGHHCYTISKLRDGVGRKRTQIRFKDLIIVLLYA